MKITNALYGAALLPMALLTACDKKVDNIAGSGADSTSAARVAAADLADIDPAAALDQLDPEAMAQGLISIPGIDLKRKILRGGFATWYQDYETPEDGKPNKHPYERFFIGGKMLNGRYPYVAETTKPNIAGKARAELKRKLLSGNGAGRSFILQAEYRIPDKVYPKGIANWPVWIMQTTVSGSYTDTGIKNYVYGYPITSISFTRNPKNTADRITLRVQTNYALVPAGKGAKKPGFMPGAREKTSYFDGDFHGKYLRFNLAVRYAKNKDYDGSATLTVTDLSSAKNTRYVATVTGRLLPTLGAFRNADIFWKVGTYNASDAKKPYYSQLEIYRLAASLKLPQE